MRSQWSFCDFQRGDLAAIIAPPRALSPAGEIVVSCVLFTSFVTDSFGSFYCAFVFVVVFVILAVPLSVVPFIYCFGAVLSVVPSLNLFGVLCISC